MKIGKVIFYDAISGAIIVDTGEWDNVKKSKTIEEQIATYTVLSERQRVSFDYIELKYGQYAQDFAECIGYRVNPEMRQLEFSYPNPNETESSEPIYGKPLTEEIEEVKQAQLATDELVLSLIESMYL